MINGLKILEYLKIDKIWLAVKDAFKKDYIKFIFVFFVFFSFLSIIYFPIDRLASWDDPLFNIRFAEIIKEKGLSAFSDFHWLSFSNISQGQTYVSYNFLFYLLLIPFTLITPLFLAIKLYGIIFFSLSFTTLYYFLLKIEIKKPFLWVIALFALINSGLLNRFLVARSFAFAPVLLILELYFLYRKKYWGIFLISLGYFYWHNATFFFPLIIAVLFAAFQDFYGKKPDWRLVLSSAAAIIIAFALAIFFTPGLLSIFNTIFLIFYDTIFGKTVSIAEGVELYPADFFDYIRFNIPIMVLFVSAVVFEIYQYIDKKRNQGGSLPEANDEIQPIKGTLFFLSLMFFLGIFLSQRNGDFFVFFSAVYIAISFDRIVKYIEIKNIVVKKSIISACLIIVGYLFVGNLLSMQNQIASIRSIDSVRGAAEWLKNNTEKREVIFNTTWDWFPMLFYYNTYNYYTVGLEPRSFYEYNKEMYWAWWNISMNGYICLEEQCNTIKKQQQYFLRNSERREKWYKAEGDKMADYIKNNFNSRFVLTSKSFGNFNLIMDNNKHFERVYTDGVYGEFYVYKINKPIR